MANLVIKIEGDVSSYKTALEDAQKQTEGTSELMQSTAKTAGVAFAVLAAEALVAVHAFAESQLASNRLTAALQQQGIYTKELVDDYTQIAEAIQRKTGIDDDEVKAALASAQAMLGQTKITSTLTSAVADLAAAKGIDLNQAFQLVTKAATVNTEILKRYGIEVVDTGDKAQNLAAIQDALNIKFAGQAEAAAQGLGGVQKLKTAFGDVQEEIGQRLAPAFELIINGTTEFFRTLKENKALLDLIVSFGVAAAGVAALTLAVSAGGAAFLALRAALIAAQVATSAMTIATRLLVGATGIGALLAIVTLVALNWDQVWPRMQAVYAAFTKSIIELAGGVGKVLLGVFTFNTDKVSEGLAQAKAALVKGMTEYNTVVDQKLKEKDALEEAGRTEQDAAQKAAADREEARLRAHAAIVQQITQLKKDIIVAQINDESAEVIKLKQQELQVLEQMEDQKNASLVGKLRERLAELRNLEQIQRDEDLATQTTFRLQLLTQNAEYQALEDEQKALFIEQNKVTLQAALMSENEARRAAALERANIQVKENNDFLLQQQKFGTAYALINKIMHSSVVQGTASAFQDLAALQTSSNSTLKSIGKAAAVANIIVQTATSAMNIYAGFSMIPIVGPALGVAGAAAAVAFGAEQMGKVTAAADGGLMTGGRAGFDSIPTMTMPGELVVPTRNFEEVINATAAARLGESAGPNGTGGSVNIMLSLKDDLMDFIEAKLVEREKLNLSIQRA